MIKGKLSVIGRMEIDGEELTGAFVECSEEELKENVNLFCENVTIDLAVDKFPPPICGVHKIPLEYKGEGAWQCPKCRRF
jgi:hypothetical protein